MVEWVKNLNPFSYKKKTLMDSAASLAKFEQMKEAEFLSKLTNHELKKFFLAQSQESKKNLLRLDMISKEIKRRGMK